MVEFSKYEFNNKLLGNVTLLHTESNLNFKVYSNIYIIQIMIKMFS